MIIDGFEDIEDLKKEYEITDEQLQGYEILFACYETGCYDGSSIVLLKKDDKLYIIDAGHCSCYGLEGQWYPVETTKELLIREANAKTYNSYMDNKKFVDFVNQYFNHDPSNGG